MDTKLEIDLIEPRHGGDLARFGECYGKKKSEIIDFSSNVNPLGVPESLVKTYLDSLRDLSAYPDPYSRALSKKIASFFSLPYEHVIAGNGSTGILDAAVRALRPKRALLIEPCFGEYRRLLGLQGSEILSVVMSREDDFKFPLGTILSRLNSLDLLILGHPNNPTGTALS